ncbi:hypothetical protein [Pseudoteredinibacter isoporae]|uniref:Biopolymer transport protein ExbD n=1 Tax=Pseudoteredinibacter isoporae TaxID=570281 RepID=A0A7X0MUH8_9GAMM|nr:hypothetical protein [Pseudoteredinibacter isoporae]MBB6520035.1 biopolymer transport protein ExbD [Pseudoteredinibacter isoporae]NHO85607.1 hypothetical protein [Pseudoteredinibacter isoporae]NIB25941.1 hypothetical protein [Pseudoteredinibacter isoporae]
MNKLLFSIILITLLNGCAHKKSSNVEDSILILKIDEHGSYLHNGRKLDIKSFESTVKDLPSSISKLSVEVSSSLSMNNMLKLCTPLSETGIEREIYYMDDQVKKYIYCE